MPKKKRSGLLSANKKFSQKNLLIFGLLFALIGGIVIWRSFALGMYSGVLESENLNLSSGTAKIVSDSSASNAKAVVAKGTGSGSGTINVQSTSVGSDVEIPCSIDSTSCGWQSALTTVAYVSDCTPGTGYSVSVNVDGIKYQKSLVTATSWQKYTTKIPFTFGKHKVTVNYTPGYVTLNTLAPFSSKCALHGDYLQINTSQLL